jgi:RNA polymerase sigma-70 factor (ECF subfamily)
MTADPAAEARDRADMAALQAGKDAALNDLMERHAPGVFRFLAGLTGNEAEAEDLAQETFVRVFKARATYRPAQPFATWLYTIAANLARNQFRWRSRHPNVPLDAPARENGGAELTPAERLTTSQPGPDESLARAERIAAVRQAVQALPPDLRAALVLCEWEERPVAEAAVILASTTKAVESRLYRARQQLRSSLRAWWGGSAA